MDSADHGVVGMAASGGGASGAAGAATVLLANAHAVRSADLAGWRARFPDACSVKIYDSHNGLSAHLAEVRGVAHVEIVEEAYGAYGAYGADYPPMLDLTPLCCVRTLLVNGKYCYRRVKLGNMKNITSLALSRCTFNTRWLPYMKQLQSLTVRDCKYYDEVHLSYLPDGLLELVVFESPVLSLWLKNLTRLKTLKVTGVEMTNIFSDMADENLASLVSLERVELEGAWYRFTGSALLHMPKLRYVSLRYCYHVTDAAVRALWAAMACQSEPCTLAIGNCALLTVDAIPFAFDEPPPFVFGEPCPDSVVDWDSLRLYAKRALRSTRGDVSEENVQAAAQAFAKLMYVAPRVTAAPHVRVTITCTR